MSSAISTGLSQWGNFAAGHGALPMGLSWAFERPLAGALFVLPLAVLLLSFQRRRPSSVWLGTARFFPDQGKKAGSEQRRSVPWSRVLAVAAMVAATLALMGPAPAPGEPGPERFVCVVDRSPSMYLSSATESGEARQDRDPTRLAAAFEALRDSLQERSRQTGRAVELIWVDGSKPGAMAGEPVPLHAGCPLALAQRPGTPLPEPGFGAYDGIGTVWITDRVPRALGQWAGYAASGGASVPGVIGTTKSAGGEPAALHWGGGAGDAPTVVEGGACARVFLDPALPAMLADLAALWAADRGALVVQGRDRAEPVQLTVTQSPGEGTGPGGRVGRDGWNAVVKGANVSVRASGDPGQASPLDGPLPWLVLGDGTAVITSAPGAIVCGVLEFLTPPTDGAAFAVSIAALLDGAILAHPAVVPMGERRDAGEARVVLPEECLPLEDLDPRTLKRLARQAAARAAGGLLLAAALAGAIALWLRIVRS